MENNYRDSEEKPLVLIVDDNPQNLQVLGMVLQEQNFSVEFAINGATALEWVGSQQFDLILLDVNMPEMDGFEVCVKIRNNKAFSKIPIIFLTANADRESILKGLEMGGQDYVTKPFDSRELIARVKTHIALKDSLEKLENINKYLETKVRERTLELIEANSNLEKMNIRLSELDNAKTEFLNLLSHEIRTPLNGMILPLELLKDPISQDETKELIEILDSSVRRLEKFSLNALLITRLKTKPSLKQDVLNINNIIDEIILAYQPELNKKNLIVRTSRRTDQCMVRGEEELIKKCIFCIFENSINFSPTDDEIELDVFREDQKLVIAISDNGEGISDEIIKNGSEPFSRGNNYLDKSCGLGLPLAILIMKAHNGEIRLANKKDGGAKVELRFFI